MQVERLRVELDEYFSKYKTVDHSTLSRLQHLDAVINETMRLHPPVPSGVQRQTPREGLLVGEIFIPGNTIVQVPFHTMFRGMMTPMLYPTVLIDVDARFFEKPGTFIPERWTSRRDLVKNEAVYIPFSTGDVYPRIYTRHC
jgi:cytochrome P450